MRKSHSASTCTNCAAMLGQAAIDTMAVNVLVMVQALPVVSTFQLLARAFTIFH